MDENSIDLFGITTPKKTKESSEDFKELQVKLTNSEPRKDFKFSAKSILKPKKLSNRNKRNTYDSSQSFSDISTFLKKAEKGDLKIEEIDVTPSKKKIIRKAKKKN